MRPLTAPHTELSHACGPALPSCLCRFIKGIAPNTSSVADDWVRLSNNGFLVSLMGNEVGATPGRIGEVS